MAERVGQQFGQYRLSRLLGQGSFGEVYLGQHIHNHTLAAVKVLQAQLTAEDLKEFINEASITFRLQHPHIVRLLDFGISPTNTPFLVMAYAANGTLRQRHPKGSRLSLESITAYVSPIASALQRAHDERLIHRDVKPENILLGPDNEVWLSDFGITSVAHSTRSLNIEKPGGTVPYMAPEQLRGKARPASDQYALGIMIYEWLCGERPFSGTATEIAMQHFLEPPPSLREKMPTISPELEHVVMTALAKDPASRFASVQLFATALQAAVSQQSLLDPGSTRTSSGSTDTVATASITASVDGAKPTVQTNEQNVAILPPKGPSAHTVTSGPPPSLDVVTNGRAVTSPSSPDVATDRRAVTQPPAAQKKSRLSVSATPNVLPAHRRLPAGWIIALIVLALAVIGSGGFEALLYLTTHHTPVTPTATGHRPPTLSPYDQFVMKNGI